MTRVMIATTLLLLLVSPVHAQEERKPDINPSKDFPGVFHSPSADSTPKVFHSIFQMEVLVKAPDEEPRIVYANGTLVSDDGSIVSVLDKPKTAQDAISVLSASVLMLDGSSTAATRVVYEPAYGVAIFRVKGLDIPHLEPSDAPAVAERRVNWHAVFKNGQKTYLYTRPLRVYKAGHQLADTNDLCLLIDPGSSSLNADRSGSALVSLDGKLLGVMGRLEHWNITDKSTPSPKKLAWAVPSDVIARLLEKTESRP